MSFFQSLYKSQCLFLWSGCLLLLTSNTVYNVLSCWPGTSLDWVSRSELFVGSSSRHTWMSQISWLYNWMVLTFPDLIIALSSLYPAPSQINLSCYHGAGSCFHLDNSAATDHLCGPSAACVQVYSALYRLHRCLQLQSGHLHSHCDHQAAHQDM